MSQVLIAANDVIADKMAGPGIRCVELGRQMSLAGHDVSIVGIEATSDLIPGVEVLPPVSDARMGDLAHASDVVILEGLSLVRYPSLRVSSTPLVVDLYDPFPLALLEQEALRSPAERTRRSSQISLAFLDLLLNGDFFICASERQRDLWLGALVSTGRVNPSTWDQDHSLRRLIDVVPFGVSDTPAPIRRPGDRQLISPAIAEDDLLLLWAGGIYNWFDPLTLIRAVGRVAGDYPKVRLVFMSTTHPHPDVPHRMWMPSRARELSAGLGLTDRHVIFHDGWVPYTQRGMWLAAADCGVSTHYDHVETRYSFRTRMLDYLWAGLPIICSDGDYFADLVRDRELGWVVPPENDEALAQAIQSLIEQGSTRKQMVARVHSVAQTMTWAEVVGPLRSFCDGPVGAADAPRTNRGELRSPLRSKGPALPVAELLRRGFRHLRSRGVASTARRVAQWWGSRRSRV